MLVHILSSEKEKVYCQLDAMLEYQIAARATRLRYDNRGLHCMALTVPVPSPPVRQPERMNETDDCRKQYSG